MGAGEGNSACANVTNSDAPMMLNNVLFIQLPFLMKTEKSQFVTTTLLDIKVVL
jgi:hypothetical protein